MSLRTSRHKLFLRHVVLILFFLFLALLCLTALLKACWTLLFLELVAIPKTNPLDCFVLKLCLKMIHRPLRKNTMGKRLAD